MTLCNVPPTLSLNPTAHRIRRQWTPPECLLFDHCLGCLGFQKRCSAIKFKRLLCRLTLIYDFLKLVYPMTKSRPLSSQTRQAAPSNWRSKSSPEALQVESRDIPSTRKEGSETKGHIVSRKFDLSISVCTYAFLLYPVTQGGTTNIPPKTFHDILPPDLITTSTLSEAGYMGYRKSKFQSTRASTFPVPHASQTVKHVVKLDQPTHRTDYPPPITTRRSTLKKMKGVMHSIKRSISTINDQKKKSRPPIPSSSTFSVMTSRSRFGTGPGRQTFGRQDGGYLNLSDEEVVVGADLRN